MRIVLLAVIVAALTAPAFAQGKRGNRQRAPEQKSEEQKKKADAKEQAYKAAIESLPDKSFDPWQSMRGAEPATRKPK